MTGYSNITAMEPLFPSKGKEELKELSVIMISKASALNSSVSPLTAEGISSMVKVMNSYYSNLIEGHRTTPADIEKALNKDYSNDPSKRALQIESKAHIEVEDIISDLINKNEIENISSGSFFKMIHKEFYLRMPEEYKLVKNSETGKISEVIPGEFRTEDVIVGKHFAPAHSSIPGFMDRFKEFYNPAKYDSTDKIIAAAASHHRFSWIHPFLDGNGRVNRLYTGAWFLFSGINEKRLWSLSRGLSRNRDEYNNRLANADTERKNDYDGRGNLSDEELYLFCTFIILTSIDQIDFMSSLLVLNKIEERIINFARLKIAAGELKPGAAEILRDVFLRGSVPRGDMARITGKAESSARAVLSEMINKKLIISDTPKGPVRMNFPSEAVPYLFPGLFPPDEESGIINP